MLEHKALTLEDLTDEGKVRARIATLNVIDKDRDVTLPGFFGDQATRMVWSHNRDVWIGKGAISEQDDAAVFTGGFFMDTQAGSEAFKAVKNMGDLAEWSYGFRLKNGGFRFGEFEGERVRFLTPVAEGVAGADVYETSPVLQGAGVGTRTLAMKAWAPGDPIPTDTTLRDEITVTLNDVKALAESVTTLHAHLIAEGHTLSETKATVLAELVDGLNQAVEAVSPILETPEPPPEDPPVGDLAVELAAMHAHMQHLLRT